MTEYLIRDSRRMRVPAPPTLDATQRMDGYNKSLQTRRARAELKKDLKAGKLQLRQVLTWNWVQGMKLHDLVKSLPGYANRKAAAVLKKALIHEANTVGRCSQKQLERVVSLVEKR